MTNKELDDLNMWMYLKRTSWYMVQGNPLSKITQNQMFHSLEKRFDSVEIKKKDC